jgi:hypothetical protein
MNEYEQLLAVEIQLKKIDEHDFESLFRRAMAELENERAETACIRLDRNLIAEKLDAANDNLRKAQAERDEAVQLLSNTNTVYSVTSYYEVSWLAWRLSRDFGTQVHITHTVRWVRGQERQSTEQGSCLSRFAACLFLSDKVCENVYANTMADLEAAARKLWEERKAKPADELQTTTEA